MNLKFGECWEDSEKDLLKLCQKLENSVKTSVVMQNIERVFILFLRITHIDFRSRHLELRL